MTRPKRNLSPTDKMPTTVLLVHAGVIAEIVDFNFIDGSVVYNGREVKNAFDFTLFDNIGNGVIRITYNSPSKDITSYVNGAKTLKAGDSFYIEEEIKNVKIYFVEASIVELVLKSEKYT